MRPKLMDIVDAGIGNSGAVQPCHCLGRGQAGEALYDEGGERLAVGDTPDVGIEAWVRCQLRPLEHGLAEDLPLALVLKPQHHRFAVAGRKRTIWENRRVRRPAAWRRRLLLEGV